MHTYNYQESELWKRSKPAKGMTGFSACMGDQYQQVLHLLQY